MVHPVGCGQVEIGRVFVVRGIAVGDVRCVGVAGCDVWLGSGEFNGMLRVGVGGGGGSGEGATCIESCASLMARESAPTTKALAISVMKKPESNLRRFFMKPIILFSGLNGHQDAECGG